VTFKPDQSHDASGLQAGKLRGVHLAIVVNNKDGDDNPGYRIKIIHL